MLSFSHESPLRGYCAGIFHPRLKPGVSTQLSGLRPEFTVELILLSEGFGFGDGFYEGSEFVVGLEEFAMGVGAGHNAGTGL